MPLRNDCRTLASFLLAGVSILFAQPVMAQNSKVKAPPFVWADVGYTQDCAPNDMFGRLLSLFSGPRPKDENAEMIFDEPLYNAVSGDTSRKLFLDEPQDWHGLKLTGVELYAGIERGPANYAMVFAEDAATVRATWNKLGWKLPEGDETREMIEGYAFMGVQTRQGGGAMVVCFRD